MKPPSQHCWSLDLKFEPRTLKMQSRITEDINMMCSLPNTDRVIKSRKDVCHGEMSDMH
jgi:hypothetical protein